MTTASPQGSPRPARRVQDGRTRERLRDAQQQEARAVAGVCAAEAVLEKACAKRDAALAAATTVVDRAQAKVTDAQTALVKVSGLSRAALLLGLDSVDLRKVTGTHNRTRVES